MPVLPMIEHQNYGSKTGSASGNRFYRLGWERFYDDVSTYHQYYTPVIPSGYSLSLFDNVAMSIGYTTKLTDSVFLKNNQSFINSSGNTYDGDISNGDRPRLYLMDYMYGVEDTIAQRDITSNNMMDSLICDYRPLILKSSNLQVVKQGQGSSQGEQLSFGLPVSHNYLQIYTG